MFNTLALKIVDIGPSDNGDNNSLLYLDGYTLPVGKLTSGRRYDERFHMAVPLNNILHGFGFIHTSTSTHRHNVRLEFERNLLNAFRKYQSYEATLRNTLSRLSNPVISKDTDYDLPTNQWEYYIQTQVTDKRLFVKVTALDIFKFLVHQIPYGQIFTVDPSGTIHAVEFDDTTLVLPHFASPLFHLMNEAVK